MFPVDVFLQWCADSRSHFNSFNDHKLFSSENCTNNVFISRAQDTIVSYCSNEGDTTGNDYLCVQFASLLLKRSCVCVCVSGSINISNILNGELLGKISCGRGQSFDGDKARALSDVSALYLDETSNTIYTGSKDGMVYAW